MLLKDVLHYYIGCKYSIPSGACGEVSALTFVALQLAVESGPYVKLHLRKLEDMTEEEAVAGGWRDLEAFKYYMDGNHGAIHPGDFVYLLSIGMDLFGLIESGSAIDIKTLQP